MKTTGRGFLLSRHSYDRQDSTQIDLWLATDDGPVKLSVTNEKPVFFIRRKDADNAKALLVGWSEQYITQLLSLKTFQHDSVTGFYFNSLRSFYDAREHLLENNIELFESNIRLADRYLMERFTRGGVAYIGDSLGEKNFSSIANVKIKPTEYIPHLKVLSLDIECNVNGELFSIGLYGVAKGKVYQRVLMIGNPENVSSEQSYIQWVDNEVTLLKAFERISLDYDPDVYIGWSVVNFDFRILCQRADFHGLKINIGRNKTAMRWRNNQTEPGQGFVTIEGRVVIDGITALKAEAYMLPRYSLEYVAQHFLKKGKETEDVDNRLATILHDFKFNKPKLAAYNLQDCVLVWEIFEKANLLDFLIFRSHLTGLELDRAGGSVAAFVNLYLPKLHRHGYVSPNLPKDGGLASPGGYVMDSIPGLYKNVLVLDFKSLYPSIIRTYKIDPLGLVEGLKHSESAIPGFKGAVFDREKNLLPDIITELWKLRDQAKADNDSARSQAIKILMNSFYGVLGSGGCPFYDTRLASSITLRGHDIMQQTAQWIEARGLQVIYGDTDSTFVHLDESLSAEQARQIGKDLAAYINAEWALKIKQELGLESQLEIEFETHFSRFLMPTIRGSEKGSKKRYAGLIKNHGQEDKLVFKGLENVRTDWTELAKQFQERLYAMLFREEDPCDFIKRTVSDTLAGKQDALLVYRKRLRRPLDSYIKNIPPHVKAARLADEKNKQQGKQIKYQRRGWISYVITTQGPQPTEYQTASIDYQHYIDKQIEPVADAILPFVGMSFKEITDAQLGLF
ncbi:DNA polymerase II [Aliikangiella marina]|uniref:DNA polymerase n=1 Tax=Aliikangiella marina TaxID=1712262 RepID=A0A545TD89_9GAMM|nr:DNA polymerase II [Aliikangiella marina]TQV75180.1 DNA polymerase II [Aliikangiella marina]